VDISKINIGIIDAERKLQPPESHRDSKDTTCQYYCATSQAIYLATVFGAKINDNGQKQ
jgi:hypothetical protein